MPTSLPWPSASSGPLWSRLTKAGRTRASMATDAASAARICTTTGRPMRAATMPITAPAASIARIRSRLNISATPSTIERPSQVSQRWSRIQSMVRPYPVGRDVRRERRARRGVGAPRSGRPRGSAAAASPKVSDSDSAVTTSSTGPESTTRPSRSSSAWVKPGGISSTWCETSTVAGESGSRASSGQRRDQVLAPAEVEAGGRLVEQQQLGVGHQRPGDLHPLALALAEGAEGALGQVVGPDLGEQRRRPGRGRGRRTPRASGPRRRRTRRRRRP